MDGLKKHFRRGRRYVVLADDGTGEKTVLFLSKDAVLRRQQPGAASFAICDLAVMWENFTKYVGTAPREFGVPEVAALCGWNYAVLDARLRDGTIVATACPARGHGHERRFRYTEAFIAAACATLARHGANFATMRRVREIITDADEGRDVPTTAGAFAAV